MHDFYTIIPFLVTAYQKIYFCFNEMINYGEQD